MATYMYNYNEVTEKDFKLRFNYATEMEVFGGGFDRMLNDSFDDVEVTKGRFYSVSDILYAVDNPEYNHMRFDYLEYVRKERTYQLENGQAVSIDGKTFLIKE